MPTNWSRVAGQFTQNQDLVGGHNAIAITAAANITAGNVAVISVQFYDGTGVAPTVTDASDENGKTYTTGPHSPAPDTAALVGNVFQFYMIAPSGAGKHPTITFSKNFTVAVIDIDEFALSSGTIVFDNDAVSADGASGSSVTTPTVPCSGSDCLLIAHGASQVNFVSADSPWTASQATEDALGGFSEFILGASSNTAVAFTNNGSVNYAVSGMSFKASGGAPTDTLWAQSLM